MHDLPPPPPYVFCTKLFASIIKKPPSKVAKDPAYQELDCTEQDRANIGELITTMANNSKLGLLMKSSHLRNIGAQISHVHALKFLAVIFANPILKECMWDIFDDHFKKSNLMDSISASLSREMEKGKLLMYLEGFAAEVGHHPCNTPHLQTLFAAREWEDLVKFLMRNEPCQPQP